MDELYRDFEVIPNVCRECKHFYIFGTKQTPIPCCTEGGHYVLLDDITGCEKFVPEFAF